MLTRAGKDLFARPGRLCAELLPHDLFRLDHGASLNSLRRTLCGQPDSASYDETALALFIGVLRPLCWAALRQKPH